MRRGPLDGVVAVVTGASRGIGLATAAHLASRGAAVAICSRNLGEVHAAASRLVDETSWSVSPFQVDVGRADDVARFADRVRDQLGPADIVINNAAILGPVGALFDVAPDEWSHALDVNVLGAVHTSIAFAEQLRRSRNGRVLNLSGGGVGGPRAMRRTSAYVVSKAAIVALTESLAHDFHDGGVTVNAIAPGAFPTSFMVGVLSAGVDRAGRELLEDAKSRVGKSIQPAQAQPFFDLLDYLLSNESSWLTGRMLSARWETPQRLEALRSTITDSMFTLRRIDGDLYFEEQR